MSTTKNRGRGALRWSLTKLRPLVDDPQRTRLVAVGDTVRLDTTALTVDVLELRRAVVASRARSHGVCGV